MKILALISFAQPPVLDRILTDVGTEDVEPRSTGPPAWVAARAGTVELMDEEIEWDLIDLSSEALAEGDPVYEEPVWTATH